MKKKSILILFFLLQSYLFAIPEAKIRSVINTKIVEVLSILDTKNISKETQKIKIYSLFDVLFDFKVMSLISLGKQWKHLSEEQKKNFTNVLEKKIKQSFEAKLNLYTNQKFEIDKIKKVKKSRIELYARLTGKNETLTFTYKFYKQKNKDNWLIYDITVLGISALTTYRKQFKIYLQKNTIDDLIKKLSTNTI